MGGHSLHAVELPGVLLPGLLEDGEVVLSPQADIPCVTRANAGHRGEEAALAKIAVQLQEGDVHAKPWKRRTILK